MDVILFDYRASTLYLYIEIMIRTDLRPFVCHYLLQNAQFYSVNQCEKCMRDERVHIDYVNLCFPFSVMV